MRLAHITHTGGGMVLLNLSEIGQLGGEEKSLNFSAQLSKELSQEASGVILEPISGFQALDEKAADAGVIFSLATEEIDNEPTSLPVFYPNWGVEYVRHNYGLAHLKLYFNPDEEQSAKKLQIAAEVYDHCQFEGIDLMIELCVFALSNEKTTLEEFQNTQVEAITLLRDKCDAMALEYPHSALACATLTAELDIPWILVDRTPEYEDFKEQVRTALEAGASGVMMGNILWQGMDEKNFSQIMETQARDRVIELSRIVYENVNQSTA